VRRGLGHVAEAEEPEDRQPNPTGRLCRLRRPGLSLVAAGHVVVQPRISLAVLPLHPGDRIAGSEGPLDPRGNPEQYVCAGAPQSPARAVTSTAQDPGRGRPRIGTFLSLGSPEATAVISSRLDLVLIDAEHGVGDERTLLAQLRAARCPHRWIRVGSVQDAAKALDLGADGVVVPRIRAASEVDDLVTRCSFPPDGTRGLGPSATNLYGALMHVQVLGGTRQGELWPQIETMEAVEALPEILAVRPAPSGLFIGPGDLSAALGHPGDLGHPRVRQTIEHVLHTCIAAGRDVAIFSPGPSDAERWLALGASTVIVGSDAGWMIAGANPVWELAEHQRRSSIGPVARSPLPPHPQSRGGEAQ
jgi:4-hydroxy-2-oxoheptanedioate aldolase